MSTTKLLSDEYNEHDDPADHEENILQGPIKDTEDFFERFNNWPINK
jgi:hypothetical protein